MPSCLGICIEKNLIKYAKLTREKNSQVTQIDSFGIKFYDSLADTVNEIIDETQSATTPICVGLNSEDYTTVNVFSGLSQKDIKSLVNSEFQSLCKEKEVNPAALDMRFKLVKNTGMQDTYKAICIAANNTELSNLGQVFSNYKLSGILSVGLSAQNLFRNRGTTEKMAVVNIEDDTKVTVFSNGEIAEIVSLPIGMDEVFTRLADKFNSYARAYEACKGVNAYTDADLSLDDEAREINDVLMPVLYDLKQRIVSVLEAYNTNLKSIYITGTGVIINNIDLYFQEAFPNIDCEILVPYFVEKERNDIKDILEVNNALAVAAYGLDGVDKETDFYLNNSYLRTEAGKKMLKKDIPVKDIMNNAIKWMDDLNSKMKRKVKTKPRKVSVAFDDEVEHLDQINASSDFEVGGASAIPNQQVEDEEKLYDPVDEWLCRVAISTGIAFIAYTGVSHYTGVMLADKLALTNSRTAKVETQIKNVQTDIDYINQQSAEYKTKTNNLSKILETIRTQQERSFDVPNLLSRLMFSIPDEVKVTSIKVTQNEEVSISAESGRYTQLGYFVSKLKLEGVLEQVNMRVVSMDADSIKIVISGVLP